MVVKILRPLKPDPRVGGHFHASRHAMASHRAASGRVSTTNASMAAQDPYQRWDQRVSARSTHGSLSMSAKMSVRLGTLCTRDGPIGSCCRLRPPITIKPWTWREVYDMWQCVSAAKWQKWASCGVVARIPVLSRQKNTNGRRRPNLAGRCPFLPRAGVYGRGMRQT